MSTAKWPRMNRYGSYWCECTHGRNWHTKNGCTRNISQWIRDPDLIPKIPCPCIKFQAQKGDNVST